MTVLSRKWIYSIGIVFVGIILYFSPQIDPIVAKLAFNPTTSSFYGNTSLICYIVYHIVPYLVALMVIIPIVYFLWAKYKYTTPARFNQARRFFIIVILSLVIGPGLIVNIGFKENWGRPRPMQVLKDKQKYTPIWQPNFAEPQDNSFPSGHASIGFFLGVPLFVLGYKRLASIVSLIAGIIIGIVRILQGGHYLSDVICAGLFVWICSYLIMLCYDKYLFKGVKNA